MNRLRMIMICMAVLLFAGMAAADEYQVSKKTNDFEVMVSIDKNPPIMGDNTATITIKDGAGKAVTDVKVRVDYGMPAMPGMPAMNYKSDATASGESFTAPLNFSMSGAWNVAVKILQSGKVSTVKFSVDVR